MRRLMIRHRVSDETGAVLPIVVLSLIALFGMVVLTVDVGGLMVKRRNMVNAADAAALAAAQSYANDDAICGSSDAIAHAEATALAGDNVSPTISETQYTPNCTDQTVKVGYESPADLFFAPVLGFGNSTMVRSTATALWGTLAGGNAVPIVLESGTLQGICDVPNIPNGTQCAFWYDNNDLGNASWGFMNLDQWNVSPGTNCSNAGASSRSDWIANGYPDPRVLNGNPPGTLPTYVCVDTGHTSRDWFDLQAQVGKVKLFPVNDCQGQLDKSGTVAPCPATPDKYDIIGFTSLLIVATYKGNDPQAIGTPGASGTCSKSNQSLNYLQQVNLGSFGVANNCFKTAPDNIPMAGVQVLPKTGPAYLVCAPANPLPGNCDATYDEATGVLTWQRPPVSQVTITFDWSNDNVGGACPGHSSDPNAICLVTEWQGFKVYSGPVGQGPDFGARGVRLLE